jgi:hypothetical protein
METNDTNTPEPIDTELDDVEAHGLKEVAAGFGAAAVLGGAGAGAALAATSTFVPPPPNAVAHHTVDNAKHNAQHAASLLKGKTPNPPPEASVNSTRIYPSHLPNVHRPHITPPAVNAPDDQGAVKSTVDRAKGQAKTTKSRVDRTVDRVAPANPMVPPITGPKI